MTLLAEDDRLVAAYFRVLADAEPGLLPRLFAPLARRDLVPDAVRAWRDDGVIHAEILLEAMPAGMVALVAGNLGQIVGVRQVRGEQVAPASPRPGIAAPLRTAA